VPSEVLGARYAEALLGALDDMASMEEVRDELRAVATAVEDSKQFRTFLEGPNVGDDDKHDIVRKVFGDKVSQITLDFLKLLIDKHRVDHLGEAARQFQRLVEERRNQLRVQVTTAIPLPVDVEDRLKRALDATTGKDCVLEKRVDASILGGVIAILGERVIDGSIRTALGDLRKDLLATPL